MKVSVIIVNFNGKEFIGNCINSIFASCYSDFEIVLVDNASTDGSYEILREKYGSLGNLGKKRVKIIRSKSNLSFTGGCNLGAQKAKGEYLFFLNSDAQVERDCIRELADFTQKKPKFLVQPKILWKDNPAVIDNIGGKYSLLRGGRAVGRNEKDTGQYDKPRRFDYVNGTAFMINRGFFRKLGGFDEFYRFFYEDVDLSLRARAASGECWYCPEALVYHKGSATFRKTHTDRQIKLRILFNRFYLAWKRIIRDSNALKKLLSGAGIIFAGTALVNGLNFGFNLTMARILGPIRFGELAAIFSILFVGGVAGGIITNVLTKYVSVFASEKNFYLVQRLLQKATRFGLYIGLSIMVGFWLLSYWLVSFLKLRLVPLFLFTLGFPFLLLISVYSGFLLGMHKFTSYTFSQIIATSVKVLLGIGVVYLGFSVSGAMTAFVLGLLAAYLFIRQVSREILRGFRISTNKVESLPGLRQKIIKFAKLISITTVLAELFLNLDLLLVRHYFPPVVSGEYAALVNSGRLIFYATAPLLTVLFPLIAGGGVDGKNRGEAFLKFSLVLTAILGLGAVGVYRIIPEIIVNILFGRQYLQIVSHLAGYATVIGIYSLGRIFISYFLARSISIFIYPFALAVAGEIIWIVVFHQTLKQVISGLLIVNLFFVIACLVIYRYDYKWKQK